MRVAVLIILAAGALAACASTQHTPVSQVPNPLTATPIERGRWLHVTTCARCHIPVEPRSISMEDWDDALPRMGRKAGLPQSDLDAISQYVLSVRAEPPQSAR